MSDDWRDFTTMTDLDMMCAKDPTGAAKEIMRLRIDLRLADDERDQAYIALKNAGDEIERLRAEVKHLRAEVKFLAGDDQ